MTNDKEWVNGFLLSYHLKQWDEPKESTKAFCKFIKDKIKPDTKVLDLAAGTGAPTFYLAKSFEKTNFIASDCSKDIVSIGNKIIKEKEVPNLKIQIEDWYKLRENNEYDGVISLQTLSWLKEPKRQLNVSCKN